MKIRDLTTEAGQFSNWVSDFNKAHGTGVDPKTPDSGWWGDKDGKAKDGGKDGGSGLTGKPIVRKNDTSAEPLNDREIQELQNGFWNLDNKGQRTLLTMMKKNQI